MYSAQVRAQETVMMLRCNVNVDVPEQVVRSDGKVTEKAINLAWSLAYSPLSGTAPSQQSG